MEASCQGPGLRTGWGLPGESMAWQVLLLCGGTRAFLGVSQPGGRTGWGWRPSGCPRRTRGVDIVGPILPRQLQPSPLLASKTVFQRSSDRFRLLQHQDFQCQILRPDLP